MMNKGRGGRLSPMHSCIRFCASFTNAFTMQESKEYQRANQEHDLRTAIYIYPRIFIHICSYPYLRNASLASQCQSHSLLTTSSLPSHSLITASSQPPHSLLTAPSLPPHCLLTASTPPPRQAADKCKKIELLRKTASVF